MKLVIISIFIVLVAATTLVNGRPQEEANQPEPVRGFKNNDLQEEELWKL